MKKWFVKNLGEATFADESLDVINGLFWEEFEKENKPGNMALFIRHESDGHLQCEVKIYFSPATNVIAKKVKAIPSPKPSHNGLDIFAGSKKAWSIFFKEMANKL